jgi:hypothetical protein
MYCGDDDIMSEEDKESFPEDVGGILEVVEEVDEDGIGSWSLADSNRMRPLSVVKGRKDRRAN